MDVLVIGRYGCVLAAQVVGEYGHHRNRCVNSDLEKFFVALVRRRFEFEFELLA
jgi:hypothetical protein